MEPDTQRSLVDAEEILSRLGHRVVELAPIQWKRGQFTPLLRAHTDRGKFVLKLRTPPARLSSRIRQAVADLELATQARVYGALSSLEFSTLRFPRLVETDGSSYLLLEYLETRPHGEEDLPRRQLLDSLLEFQLAPVRFGWRGLQVPVAHTRTPFALLLRRLLLGIREELGWGTARRALEAALACRSAQPPLPRPVVCHNDFHYNNLLLDPDGRLYLTDFEAVTLDDRWVLADIVYFAVGTHRFRIDGAIVGDYHSLLTELSGLEVNLRAQVRFGLLVRLSKLILSSAPPSEVAREYVSFLEEVVLDDHAFDEWLASNVVTSEREASLSS